MPNNNQLPKERYVNVLVRMKVQIAANDDNAEVPNDLSEEKIAVSVMDAIATDVRKGFENGYCHELEDVLYLEPVEYKIVPSTQQDGTAYIVTHQHRHGEDVYNIIYNGDEQHPVPDLRKVAKSLNIDFEPECNEFIHIAEKRMVKQHVFGPEVGGTNMCSLTPDSEPLEEDEES